MSKITKECEYCRECIYYEKCAVNAPHRMECKSKNGGLGCGCPVCCANFVSRKSIDDIYEEQKAEQPESEYTTKVIDVINNNDPNMIIEIRFFNPDGKGVELFKGMIKDIPDNLKDCEVLGSGFFDCALIHITWGI